MEGGAVGCTQDKNRTASTGAETDRHTQPYSIHPSCHAMGDVWVDVDVCGVNVQPGR